MAVLENENEQREVRCEEGKERVRKKERNKNGMQERGGDKVIRPNVD